MRSIGPTEATTGPPARARDGPAAEPHEQRPGQARPTRQATQTKRPNTARNATEQKQTRAVEHILLVSWNDKKLFFRVRKPYVRHGFFPYYQGHRGVAISPPAVRLRPAASVLLPRSSSLLLLFCGPGQTDTPTPNKGAETPAPTRHPMPRPGRGRPALGCAARYLFRPRPPLVSPGAAPWRACLTLLAPPAPHTHTRAVISLHAAATPARPVPSIPQTATVVRSRLPSRVLSVMYNRDAARSLLILSL